MYDYFKNIAKNNSCNLSGVCSIHPGVNSISQILLNEIREISFYLVKLREFNLMNYGAMELCIEGLSIFLINTSYSEKKYLDFLFKLYSIKNEVKEKYTDFCRKNEFPCEIINTNFKLNKNTTISELIKYSQNNIVLKEKNLDKTKQGLFELITIFARLSAIEVVKIKKLDKTIREFDYEILRFFALTSGYSIRNEKIIRRVKEFCKIALEIFQKLNALYEKSYGKKESANPDMSPKIGHAILVSGDDLDELEKLLRTIEEINPREKINVYTNNALFLAHFYPYFKNNKYLCGHFGSDSAEYDFSTFPGAILITQNFIQKIDALYRGEIFSNKIISFSRVFDIKNNDYKPVVEACLKSEGFLSNGEKKSVKINYDRKNIEKYIDFFNDIEIIIVAGILENTSDIENIEKYGNKKILYLNCPLENDILLDVIEKLKNRNIKITLFFIQCNLSSLKVLLSLLDSNIELNIANCSYALINPHVINSLSKDFGVKII